MCSLALAPPTPHLRFKASRLGTSGMYLVSTTPGELQSFMSPRLQHAALPIKGHSPPCPLPKLLLIYSVIFFSTGPSPKESYRHHCTPIAFWVLFILLLSCPRCQHEPLEVWASLTHLSMSGGAHASGTEVITS